MVTDKKQFTDAELADLELYDFFELIAKSNISDVLVIRSALEHCKVESLGLVDVYSKKCFDTEDKDYESEKFNEYLTKMMQCFAMAMYLDKKIELCQRRQEDLTPSCFKKYEN